MQSPDKRRQFTGGGLRMMPEGIANALKLCKRRAEWTLLDAAFTHDIAQKGETHVPDLRQGIGAGFPCPQLPHHVRTVQQHHAPAQQPAARKRVLAVI